MNEEIELDNSFKGFKCRVERKSGGIETMLATGAMFAFLFEKQDPLSKKEIKEAYKRVFDRWIDDIKFEVVESMYSTPAPVLIE